MHCRFKYFRMSEIVSGKAGGVLAGKKHSEGGIEAVVDGSKKVELEGGEVIINAKAVQDDDVMTVTGTKREIASKINSDKGYGVKFKRGGEIPTVRNYTFADFLPWLQWWE